MLLFNDTNKLVYKLYESYITYKFLMLNIKVIFFLIFIRYTFFFTVTNCLYHFINIVVIILFY